MRLIYFITFALLTCCSTFADEVNIQPIPSLPSIDSQKQIGYAGPFTGIHNEVLVIAGGANFPEGLPWEKVNGKSPDKIYHDSIIYYIKDDQGKWQPKVSEIKLPEVVAYGASISHPKLGVICIGGEWRKRNGITLSRGIHDKVFAINSQNKFSN